jgi:hypothetical protein
MNDSYGAVLLNEGDEEEIETTGNGGGAGSAANVEAAAAVTAPIKSAAGGGFRLTGMVGQKEIINIIVNIITIFFHLRLNQPFSFLL